MLSHFFAYFHHFNHLQLIINLAKCGNFQGAKNLVCNLNLIIFSNLQIKCFGSKSWVLHDEAPPNSLKNSNANLKVKTMEEEGIGVRSLACSTLAIRGVCWSSRTRTRMNDKHVNYSYGPTQTKKLVSA